MTTYYVGPGGNDGNNGTTWALRKLTMNGVEDIPIASGDTAYIAPGIYREQLTCDVDGASEIAYIADVTGIHTDGVGGDVIISGSDDDTTATRGYCIYANTKSYRTFVGFHVVGFSTYGIHFDGCDNVKLKDCCCDGGDGSTTRGIYLSDTYTNVEITRCCVVGGQYYGIYISASSDQAASNVVVSDCHVVGSGYYGIYINNLDSVVVQNCTIIGGNYGVRVNSLTASTSVTLRNCVAVAYTAFHASVAGEIASTYCQVCGGTGNWSAGTGDVTDYVMNLQLPMLYGTYAGIRYPVPLLGELNPYAYAAHRTGSSETATDLFGITKPTTAAISSWGAVQFQDADRETGTVRGGSTASYVLNTAGEIQLFLPVTNVEITVSCYVYREANYAGNNPKMVIRQPGQADRTTTDAAAASQWNQLSDTFTPSADTDHVVVALVSQNTAVAGNYAVFFEDVTPS